MRVTLTACPELPGFAEADNSNHARFCIDGLRAVFPTITLPATIEVSTSLIEGGDHFVPHNCGCCFTRYSAGGNRYVSMNESQLAILKPLGETTRLIGFWVKLV